MKREQWTLPRSAASSTEIWTFARPRPGLSPPSFLLCSCYGSCASYLSWLEELGHSCSDTACCLSISRVKKEEELRKAWSPVLGYGCYSQPSFMYLAVMERPFGIYSEQTFSFEGFPCEGFPWLERFPWCCLGKKKKSPSALGWILPQQQVPW